MGSWIAALQPTCTSGLMRTRVKRIVLAAALLIVSLPRLAAAEGLLRITPVGWSPAAWDAAGMPTGPVPIGADGFRLTFQGGGSQTVLDPVLLIIGIPTATLPPNVTQTGSGDPADYVAPFDPNVTVTLGGATPYAGTKYAPTSWDSDGIIDTPFTSAAGNQSVYQFLNLKLPNSGGSDSESYANWSKTGFTSWNLFVYELTFYPDFQRGDWVEFATSPLLAAGSYVVGYGVEPSKGTNIDATPFTFAGNVQQVPEPSTVSLFVSALGLFFVVRRFQLKPISAN